MRITCIFFIFGACAIYAELLTVCHTHVWHSHMSYIHVYMYMYKMAKAPTVLHFSAFHDKGF